MINCPSWIRVSLYSFASIWSLSVFAEGPYEYSGRLVTNQGTAEECLSYVPTAQFIAKVFFVGPTGRTIVINLDSAEIISPLNGMNFVGLYGTSDFEATKELELTDRTVKLNMTGFIERGFLIFELSAVATKADGTLICSGLADYSGFVGG
jgi:hypothetical protein